MRNTLRYHGDEAAADAVLDFAVNVFGSAPPVWLQEELLAAVPRLAAYPEPGLHAEVTRAVATHHGVPDDHVLLLGGAAEGFSLLAKLKPAWPVVIHPGFTEPEACLVDAGIEVDRVILPAPYELRGDELSADCDLVVIGNPTNPTGVLHTPEKLAALAEPWRYLVVDEAFIDVVAGATSMIDQVDEVPGLIVVRSLTKTWGLAGLRCGYLVADPETINVLKRGRPHWPLGTLQLRAIRAVMKRGGEFLPEIVDKLASWRDHMGAALTAAGFTIEVPSSAPYLLVRPPGYAEKLRRELAARGVAVRRCDTFPGLDSGYWRLAVREHEQVARLLDEIEDVNRGSRSV